LIEAAEESGVVKILDMDSRQGPKGHVTPRMIPEFFRSPLERFRVEKCIESPGRFIEVQLDFGQRQVPPPATSTKQTPCNSAH